MPSLTTAPHRSVSRAAAAATILISRRSGRRAPHVRKPQPEPEPQPPAYTRTTIHQISTLLRTHPWSTAQPHLLSLPIKWDSFTVNRVLKTHPPMEKAYLFFQWAGKSLRNFKHDRFTYTTMLDIFGEAGRVGAMLGLFAEMRSRGIEADAATCTSVMHWLASDGDVDAAMEVWREMRARRGCRPTVVSYTACMKILFENGRAQEAAEVFREMVEVEGLRPNCCTYTVLIEHLADSGEVPR